MVMNTKLIMSVDIRIDMVNSYCIG